jgi:cyanuric acid amidohydrolase
MHRIPMAAPDDTSGLARLIERGVIDPADIVCLLGKTEGNGCVNDWSRGYATAAYKALLASRLRIGPEEVAERVLFIMSGGTEGVMTPHVTVFSRRDVVGDREPRRALAVGIAHTPAFLPEQIGTLAQVRAVEAGVGRAMAQAGIPEPTDVHFVQIKCPLLTAESILDAERRGFAVATRSTYGSMGYSRGASALGVALALGEIGAAGLDESAICTRWDLYSRVASTSAGVELRNCEILVLGNAPSASDLVIGHDVMADAIDAAAVRRALAAAGWAGDGDSTDRVAGVFAKAEASPSGLIRGRRHTMIDDSDINHTRHARAAVSAVIAAVIGDPMVYVSGGAEHQGPSGGGPVAAIVRTT